MNMQCKSVLHDIDWYQLLIYQNFFSLLNLFTILTSNISLIAHIYLKIFDMSTIHL
jgi:hypothetical protein